MTRAVHVSDWHARIRVPKLPEADVYICTGDMMENTDPPPRWVLWPQAVNEIPFQKKWIAEARGSFSKIFPNRAPLLLVRGNHCFVDLKPLFDDGTREIYEFMDEPSVKEICGVKFGGFRGVTEINGCWADECTERVLGLKCDMLKALGKIDVLVTHSPAYGCLDMTHGGCKIGSRAIHTYLIEGNARRHLFGHVHESAGTAERHGIKFSNAACGVNVLEI